MDMAIPIRSAAAVPTIAGHIWKLFGTSVLLVLVLVAALFWDVSQLAQLRTTARRADFIERQLRQVGEGLLEAESGQRGYLLTDDERYLEPLTRGAQAARSGVQSLEQAELDDDLRQQIARLHRLVDSELGELEAAVTQSHAGHREAARALVAQPGDRALMAQIRAVESRIAGAQFALIQERRVQVDANTVNTKLTLVVGSLAFIVLLFLYARKATRKLGLPVQALIGRMRSLAVVADDAPSAPPAVDEITWIAQEFNETVQRLDVAARERDRSERALVESRSRLQVIIDNFPGLVSNVDTELRFRFVNRTYADWFRVDPGAMIGMSLRRFLGDAEFDAVEASVRAALAGETVIRERDVMVGGALRHCHLALVPERDAAGAVVGLFAIHTDITQSKRLERELKIARDQYQSLYEATPTMLHSVDAQGRLITVSDVWLQKLGYRRDEVIGKPSGGFLAPESRARSRDIVLPELFKTGRCSNVHFQLIRADGSLLDVLLSAVLQRDPSGHVIRSLSVMEDISETLANSAAFKREHELRLELEERAAELDALLSERNEMLYVLAHEVRQPMNNASAVLQNAASLLAEKGQEREARRIGKAQQLMGVILSDIDNTLAVAALVAIDGPPKVIDTDVDTLVDIAIGDMAATERLRVRVVRQTATRTASMDPGLMRLALRNLLANALRYSPAGAPVTLNIADSDEPLALVFDVIDQGEGIPPELRPRLFERGTQGARSRHEPGHGLGLYIVRRIMEIHGGRVDLVRSDASGTVMRIILPQAFVD